MTAHDTAPHNGVEYLVAPESLRVWFAHFLSADDTGRVQFTGEHDRYPDACFERIDPAATRLAVLYSSHETLHRDAGLARRLADRGVPVQCQSTTAAHLGVDKFAMKRFFDVHGFASPPWLRPGGPEAGLGGGDPLVVVKGRHGTQSRDMRLARLSGAELAANEYAEPYLDGVEYSVLVYRDQQRQVTFPPVWKGSTSTDLVPPWRRLRLCPYPRIAPDLEQRLGDTARAIADASDTTGFVEVEYLVTPDGAELVLEINPRISGTMRISALATGVPLFSLPWMPAVAGVLPPLRYAAEVPCHGTPFIDPAAGVYATSRLTVVADDTVRLAGMLPAEQAALIDGPVFNRG